MSTFVKKHPTPSLLILAMTAMLVAACGSQIISSSPEPTAVIVSSPTQLPVVLPTQTPNPLGEVKAYRDANAGVALDYPARWFLKDDAARNAAKSAVYTVSLFSWDRVLYTPPPKDLNTLPDGATKIDITVFNQGPRTLEEAVNQYKNQDSGTPVVFLKGENWILNHGGKAAYLESEGTFGVVATMIVLVNGKVVYVSGLGNLTLFKALALSLRAE